MKAEEIVTSDSKKHSPSLLLRNLKSQLFQMRKLHWFNLDAFWTECSRVVKPGGLIVAIYNHEPGREMIDFCKQTIDAFFTNPLTCTFPNPIEYTRDNWLAYIASQDDSPLPTDPRYDGHIAALNVTFDRDSQDGLLHCDRITKVYSERII